MAQRGFLGRAVDVDAALEGVAGAAEEALEPDDAGYDGIAAAGVGGNDFARGGAVLDDGAVGEVVADLIVHPEQPERRLVAVGLVADAKPGGRDDELYPIARPFSRTASRWSRTEITISGPEIDCAGVGG